MHKSVIVILASFFSINCLAQQLTFGEVDSISYSSYMKGDWETLIETSNKALAQKIDYKNLRLRLGYYYLYFKCDYGKAKENYEKAFEFDQSDESILSALYLCGINSGDFNYANYYASLMSVDTKKYWGIKPRWADAVDAEYNYKVNVNTNRSNPVYYRAGLNMKPTSWMSVYNAVSDYTQTVPGKNIKQLEYYLGTSIALSPHFNCLLAYHYVGGNISGEMQNANFQYGRLTGRWGWLAIDAIGASMNTTTNIYDQAEVGLSVFVPGSLHFTARGSVINLFEVNSNLQLLNNRFLYAQKISIEPIKNITVQFQGNEGKLMNFADCDGVYIFNLLDQTTLSVAGTIFYSLGSHLVLFGNYGYSKKLIEFTDTYYNQHSISGGITWKF
jgi:tetratricopeptide (TPR) repeat protein